MEKFTSGSLGCLKHESPDRVLQICMDLGLIARTYVCPECGKNMSLRPSSHKTDKYEWSCRTMSAPAHRVKRSVRAGSYFERSKLSIPIILSLTHFLVHRIEHKFISCDLDVSPTTVCDWSSFIREVYVEECTRMNVPIGGEGVIVEIDESKFGKRKYNRGRRVEGKWVFGGVERGTNKCFFRVVEKRDKETLLNIIKTCILPGTTIYSDCWKSYNCLADEGFIHLTVNQGGVGVLPPINVPVASPASPSPSVSGSDVDSIPDPINGDVCVLAPRLSPVGCSADTSLESSEKETNNLVEEIYVDKQSIARGLKQELKKGGYIESRTLESISKENKTTSLKPERDKPRGTFVEKVVVNVDGNVYPEECSDFDVVVAVDIGTTYTGYAFAYSRNPNDKQIHMMRQTEGGDRGLNNQKVPSILLLTEDEKFHSFGFTARDSYHDLDQEEATKWLYFDKFKMNLHNNMEVCRDSVIRAQNGRNVAALLVFSRTLSYLKGLIERELGDQGSDLEIRWVVTVPALWTQQAKQFVREAAYMAGISSPVCPEQLLIVLEPEAASACCRNIHFNQIIKSSSKESLSKPGTYMVVDCGGGTIDITIHSLASKTGSLRELHKATGGAFGSLGIDEEFCYLLDDVFGGSFMKRFKSERPAAYNELMLSFESRKRSATPYKTNSFNIFPPFAFIDFYRKITGAEVESAVQKYNRPSDLSWSNEGILKIHPSLMDKLFQPTLDKIIEHVRAILTSRNEDEIGHLFLVGGFAESQVLQKAIKDNFSNHLQIVIPQALSLCVLKGGVLFGLDPLMVTSRKVTHSYGLGVVKPFLNGIHPPDKLVVRGGQRWCADVFERIVESGQSVPIGEVVSRKYTPASTKQKEIVLHVYSTLSRTVQFITDPEVKRCGTLRLQLINDRETPLREITFSLIFGATDVTAFVMDSSTGQTAEQIISDCHC